MVLLIVDAEDARVPELPADLESDYCLSYTSGQSEKHSLFSLEDCMNRAVDCNLLVIAGTFAGKMVERGEKTILLLFLQTLGSR